MSLTRKRMRDAQRRLLKGQPCVDCGAVPFHHQETGGLVARHAPGCPVYAFWKPRTPEVAE